MKPIGICWNAETNDEQMNESWISAFGRYEITSQNIRQEGEAQFDGANNRRLGTESWHLNHSPITSLVLCGASIGQREDV